MTEVTEADLKDGPSKYDSSRDVGEVVIGDDAALTLIDALASGDDATLQSLLSQSHWIQVALQRPHAIYSVDYPSEGPSDVRGVTAMPIMNLQRLLDMAAKNGQGSIASVLVNFANEQSIRSSDLIARSTIKNLIESGSSDVLEALVKIDPDVVNFYISHGVVILYEAVKRKRTSLVATLLRLGANPYDLNESSSKLGIYSSSMLSHAATMEQPDLVDELLQYGIPVQGSYALHTAAGCGNLDTSRYLLEKGADVNEVFPRKGWTPLHFAVSESKTDAIEVLEQSGARSDIEDKDGKTAVQLIKETQST